MIISKMKNASKKEQGVLGVNGSILASHTFGVTWWFHGN
jgi:hypothetical protein